MRFVIRFTSSKVFDFCVKLLRSSVVIHIKNRQREFKLRKFLTEKGSITLNGVSLTVNNVKNSFFEVNIIPFTWNKTNFSFLKNGSTVNLEVDLLARYLLNLK